MDEQIATKLHSTQQYIIILQYFYRYHPLVLPPSRLYLFDCLRSSGHAYTHGKRTHAHFFHAH